VKLIVAVVKEARRGFQPAQRLLELLPSEGDREAILQELLREYREPVVGRWRVLGRGELGEAFVRWMAYHCKYHLKLLRPRRGPNDRPTLVCPVKGCPLTVLVGEEAYREVERLVGG